jgi:hypothetical protein
MVALLLKEHRQQSHKIPASTTGEGVSHRISSSSQTIMEISEEVVWELLSRDNTLIMEEEHHINQ